MSADETPEATEQEELREQIKQTRAELGDTVQALSDKTDVRARVHDKMQDTKQQVHDKVDETKQQVHDKVESGKARASSEPVPLVVVAGVALALVVVLVVRRRGS